MTVYNCTYYTLKSRQSVIDSWNNLVTKSPLVSATFNEKFYSFTSKYEALLSPAKKWNIIKNPRKRSFRKQKAYRQN